ncbi:myristylprotein of the poxvirus entry/fusion-complex [Equine molluscum contagiosum-like virus]|nr:myristylprotein of the poxvirus entry/fusion-complex [Equine molluscum contagiosum-like virus]
MGQTLTALRVEETSVPGEKLLHVEFSDARKNTTVPFSEENRLFRDASVSEINPRFCLTDELTPSFCGALLAPALRQRYVLARGESCRSFSFRPGSLITDTRAVPPAVAYYVRGGERCRFLRSDFFAQDADVARCCTQPGARACPQRLRNGYATPDCDAAMTAFCAQQPGSAQCLRWLRTRRPAPLAAYADLCARALDQRYCSEFVRVTRPDFFAYSDAAILRYCQDHRGDSACWCVAPPSGRVGAIETFLGPRVCWLHECTDQSRDRKYLLFDQDRQRKRCQYVGCTISVRTLQLTGASATLVADCVSRGLARGDEPPGRRRAAVRMLPGFAHPAAALVLAMLLFYFLRVYARARVNSRVINVRRR